MAQEDHLQKSIAREVRCSGIGLHSGKMVRIQMKPAPVNHGIKFVRTDLPNRPTVSARFNKVVDTSLATVIGEDGFIVSTIEHLMAAFAGLGIDNALVETNAYELPMMDGSAGPFVRIIKSAGIRIQEAPRIYFVVNKPIILEENNKSVGIYPAPCFRVTCMIEFANCPLIGTQTQDMVITAETFEQEIADARTFGFLQEVEYMQKFGLAKGGSPDNAIVIDQDRILNEGGLRFSDEFVRHKLLDCIGDFSLIGLPIIGHVVAKRSGHAFNNAFLEKFFLEKSSWQTCTIDDVGPYPASASLKQLAK
ncbi:MAG: UDP-3-O-acyl-N-acetylglucosamine deacetylase [Desulfobacteraceae bacterium]|nr:MAG: UDP-3-O-acyl-N-acetylglucosamine deacetylase [Desulfobacteraceae bacterium]